MAHRWFLVLLVALAGCDSVEVIDYGGIVELDLVSSVDDQGELSLRLVAVDDGGCDLELLARVETGAGVRRVVIEGIEAPAGPTCRAIIPASTVVPLRLGPDLPGGYSIEVDHAGATDLYSLDLSGPAAPDLLAIRTRTTRLAE